MRARHGLVIGLIAAATAAVPALAAPDETTSLSAANPTFDFDGVGTAVFAPGDAYFLSTFAHDEAGTPDVFACNATPASPTCQDILVELKEPGDLNIKVDSDEGTEVTDPSGEVFGDEPIISYGDFDVYVYKAKADGTIEGDTDLSTETNSGATSHPSEDYTLNDLAQGYYLVRVAAFFAAESPYVGKLTFKSDAPAVEATPTPVATTEATPAPTAEPQPQQPAQQQQSAPQQQAAPQPTPAPAAKRPAAKKPKFLTKKACQKAARKLKGKKRAAALKKCAKIKKK